MVHSLEKTSSTRADMLKKHIWLKKALIALIYLAVWEAASLLVGKELLLPAPLATVRRLFELLAKGESWAYAGSRFCA